MYRGTASESGRVSRLDPHLRQILGVDEEKFEVLDIHVRQPDFRSSDD
jgi:hypothetical protein